MTHYGLIVGARIVEAAFGSTSQPAEVIHLYSTDKNCVRVRFDSGEEANFVAEFCRPAGPYRQPPKEADMDDTRTDQEKAEALKRVGWQPAGNGDGPLGEAEWWAPPSIEVPSMTVPFAEAYRLTVEASNARRGDLLTSERDTGHD